MSVSVCRLLGTIFLGASLGACAAALPEASSGPTGCKPDEIEIHDDSWSVLTRTWTATCRGKAYQCSGAARDTVIPFVYDIEGAACSRRPEDDPGYVPETPVFATPRAQTIPVVVGNDRQKRKTLRSQFQTGAYTLTFFAIPSATAEHFALYLDVPEFLADRTCDLGFLADGALIPSSRFNVKTPTGRRLKVVFESDVLDSLTNAKFVSGRVCDAEWRLRPAHLKTLAEFSTRFKEEVVWLAKTEENKAAPAVHSP